ncbi:MAG: RNA-directed DNA polymerase [Candidatus Peregrinibacteria bacterium GW2011_GWC2_39_14]|nr:MAG: RNA-directed DNA polymerase [Candidatus Peregrinibacteria bacterium GW2011_GWC2_39_14]
MDYTALCSPENLFKAFDEFICSKRKKKDVIEFATDLEENIFELSRELLSKTYNHGEYSRFHIWDPKFRIIHKAKVRDRIVHHVIFAYLYEVFDKTFIFHSYSSRLNKGTHLGVENLHKMMRKVSCNFKKTGYALKCDVKKFFASVDHEILFHLIVRKVHDKDILALIEGIIASFHTHTHTHTHGAGFRLGI